MAKEITAKARSTTIVVGERMSSVLVGVVEICSCLLSSLRLTSSDSIARCLYSPSEGESDVIRVHKKGETKSKGAFSFGRSTLCSIQIVEAAVVKYISPPAPASRGCMHASTAARKLQPMT
jgi:hypothetical protein